MTDKVPEGRVLDGAEAQAADSNRKEDVQGARLLDKGEICLHDKGKAVTMDVEKGQEIKEGGETGAMDVVDEETLVTALVLQMKMSLEAETEAEALSDGKEIREIEMPKAMNHSGEGQSRGQMEAEEPLSTDAMRVESDTKIIPKG